MVQLGLGALRAGPELLQLQLLRGALSGLRLGGQSGQRACVAGAAPLHQVRGVQPVAAQQRIPFARLCGLVLGQDLQLVLGGEGVPPRALGSRTHRPIVAATGIPGRSVFVIVIVINLSRPVQTEEVLLEVSHVSLTHRAGRKGPRRLIRAVARSSNPGQRPSGLFLPLSEARIGHCRRMETLEKTCEERDCNSPAVTTRDLNVGDVMATFDLCQEHADRLDGEQTPELQPDDQGNLMLILDNSPAQ